MLKDGKSKLYGPDPGGRLGQQIATGLTAMQRRYALEEDGQREPRRKEVAPLQTGITPPSLSRVPDAGGVRSGPKGGRPRLIEGEPWVAAGVSRRTWERRKKAGG